jgi:hypothetical protein
MGEEERNGGGRVDQAALAAAHGEEQAWEL